MISNSIIFGCEGTYLTKEERFFFKDANPWAFILFSRNLDSPNQIKTLCNDLRDCVGSNVPILIDQEGGRVARLKAPIWLDWLCKLNPDSVFLENPTILNSSEIEFAFKLKLLHSN